MGYATFSLIGFSRILFCLGPRADPGPSVELDIRNTPAETPPLQGSKTLNSKP